MTSHWIRAIGSANALATAGKAMLTAESSGTTKLPATIPSTPESRVERIGVLIRRVNGIKKRRAGAPPGARPDKTTRRCSDCLLKRRRCLETHGLAGFHLD